MSLPRYPAYKDSGVAWLGEVPKHWGIAPFYSVAAEREEPNVGMQENNLLSLSYGRIVQKDINSNDGLLPESFETYQVVRPGDIVFRLTDLQNDKRSLRTAIVEETGIITSAYVAAKPVSIEPRYLSQLFRAYDVTKVFYSMGGGLRQSMKFSDLKRLPTLLPPPEEQSAIAAFLDRETGKIDALVAEQEKLIALLKEKRQAVISHAVTKSLPSTSSGQAAVKMKDTGIAWLGEVPEHWDVRKIRWLCEIKKRISGELGHDVLSITQQGIKIKDIESNDGQISMDYSKYQFVEVGDFAMNHMDLLTGYVDISDIFGVTSPDYRVFSIMDKKVCYDRYLLYLFQMCYKNKIFYAFGQGSSQFGRWRLPTEQFNDFFFPLPPFEEQQIIASFLDRETAKLDALTAEAQRGIELLKERRSVLISAAVTGKIDVRTFASSAVREDERETEAT